MYLGVYISGMCGPVTSQSETLSHHGTHSVWSSHAKRETLSFHGNQGYKTLLKCYGQRGEFLKAVPRQLCAAGGLTDKCYGGWLFQGRTSATIVQSSGIM